VVLFPLLYHSQVLKGKGAIISEGLKGSWLEYLQQRGWQVGTYNSFDEFWKLLVKNGGWWNPIRKKTDINDVFKTPSGKFEFYSLIFKEKLDQLVKEVGEDTPEAIEKILNSMNISARGDKIFMPHHEAVSEDEAMPLYLTTYKLLTNRNGNSSNQPMMQEMFGYTTHQYWNTWAEINPETAKEYGIEDKNFMWIESAKGSIKLKAVINPAIMPDAIAVPFGLGHTSYGKYAKGYGINPYSIIKSNYDTINGNPALQATKVKISLAT